MTIHPNKFYHYRYGDSTFITKTYRNERSYLCYATDISKLLGTEGLATNWEFEKIVNMKNSAISNVFEVSPETHPEYFI